jgi:hypothetical protein
MKTIRDRVAELGMAICRLHDSAMDCARSEALTALDGDAKARDRANIERGRADGLDQAMRMVDSLRIEIERGDFR